MTMNQDPVVYIDRKTGEKVVETVMGDGALRFAYNTLLGRTLWPVLFGSKTVSAILGYYYDSRYSRRAAAALAAIPGCRADEARQPLEDYPSFNAFFTRHLKDGARPIGDGFISPADGRLMLYLNSDAERPFPLKGAQKSLKTVFGAGQSVPPGRYDIAVIRLAPVDYHRFHFPCDCRTPASARIIAGKYHSVNPVALLRHPDVYADNERQILALDASFGRFWMVDVGAFGVGTIVQTYTGEIHAKGEEKGYFKFGGSTVILIIPSGVLKFDDDIVRNSGLGIETRVLFGERIAIADSSKEVAGSLD